MFTDAKQVEEKSWTLFFWEKSGTYRYTHTILLSRRGKFQNKGNGIYAWMMRQEESKWNNEQENESQKEKSTNEWNSDSLVETTNTPKHPLALKRVWKIKQYEKAEKEEECILTGAKRTICRKHGMI
ncbi:hypothetical protein ABZX51_007963 [Aspergillus tubingensis]